MNISGKLMPALIVGFLVLGAGAALYRSFGGGDANGAGAGKLDLANLNIPEFTALAAQGKTAFNSVCAACHGKNAAGTEKGPPLVFGIYNPGHHADEAFFRATKMGVRAHHWRFGNMPAQPQVTNNQITAIVRYIRELQEANGIFYRQHSM